MSRADTLKEAADHFYALADLFTQLAADTPVSGGPVAAVPPAAAPADIPPSFDELPPEEWTEPVGDQGFAAQCPRHRKPYREGKTSKRNPSGKFCATKADDAWSYNGWCSITPSNAAEWANQAAAA